MENKTNKEIIVKKNLKDNEREDKTKKTSNNDINIKVKDINEKNNKIKENDKKRIKNSNSSQALKDKIVKLYIEREKNKYKYNIVDLPENLKYSSDNSEESNSQISKIKKKNNNNVINKNEEKEEKIKENIECNNDFKKKNKINKNEDNKNENPINEIHKNCDVKNNKKEIEYRNKRQFYNEEGNKNYSMKIKDDKNKNINKNNVDLNLEENEEEKNKRLYRLLLLKNLNNNKEQNDDNDEKNKKKKNDNNEKEVNEEAINNKNKSFALRVSPAKEKQAKEGALKILELIKAKKNEKVEIDKMGKEAKEAFNRGRTLTIDYNQNNLSLMEKERENDDVTNKKYANKITENKNKLDTRQTQVIEKKRRNEKKIYKKKGYSSLTDSININSKDEYDIIYRTINYIKDNEKSNEEDNKNEIRNIINVNKRVYNNNKYTKEFERYNKKYNKISLKKKFNIKSINKEKLTNTAEKNNLEKSKNNLNVDITIFELKTERNSTMEKHNIQKQILEENNKKSIDIIDKINKFQKYNKSNISIDCQNIEDKVYKKNITLTNNNSNYQILNKSSSCFQTILRNNNNKQKKIYQKPKKSIDYSYVGYQYQNSITDIYTPKKCIMLNKKVEKKFYQFSPKYKNKNLDESKIIKKQYITYVKKNPKSQKKKIFHNSNRSYGNLSNELKKVNSIYIKNKNNNRRSTDNLNSINSNIDIDLNNKSLNNKNYNINSYNNKYSNLNEEKFKKKGNIKKGNNTFYIKNYSENNNINNNISLFKINNIFNNTFKNNNHIIKNLKDDINEYKNDENNYLKKTYNITESNNYKSNKNNNLGNINISNINNINNNSPSLNLFSSFKFEELLILDDKLNNIIYSLNNEKLISNECFDYWNYFFNCSLYENIHKILTLFDFRIKELIKISLNYKLMSIMISYNISFDCETLNRIRPLLSEMLELCHKLLLIIYEYIINERKINYNIWVKKIDNLIQNLKLYDDSDSMLISSNQNKISKKERMNYNLNFLMQKIYYILSNYPSYASNSMINIFKNLKGKTYEEIDDFFRDDILREKGLKYSILGSSFLKSGENITPKPFPYLTYSSQKKYTLILDIDETLFNFRLNEEDEEQGILKIRPGVFQFIDQIKKYYEIILFSEAESSYIDLLTDAIGNNNFLYDCVLSREYISIEGKDFLKDLNKIGRSLEKTIIIDNMPQNFRNNKENSIYIKSFWGDENDDKALFELTSILINIAKSGGDVRKELVKYKEKIVTKISSNIYKYSNI